VRVAVAVSVILCVCTSVVTRTVETVKVLTDVDTIVVGTRLVVVATDVTISVDTTVVGMAVFAVTKIVRSTVEIEVEIMVVGMKPDARVAALATSQMSMSRHGLGETANVEQRLYMKWIGVFVVPPFGYASKEEYDLLIAVLRYVDTTVVGTRLMDVETAVVMCSLMAVVVYGTLTTIVLTTVHSTREYRWL